jgi:hypothetical protein
LTGKIKILNQTVVVLESPLLNFPPRGAKMLTDKLYYVLNRVYHPHGGDAPHSGGVEGVMIHK